MFTKKIGQMLYFKPHPSAAQHNFKTIHMGGTVELFNAILQNHKHTNAPVQDKKKGERD
jgi:hypothetical protein